MNLLIHLKKQSTIKIIAANGDSLNAKSLLHIVVNNQKTLKDINIQKRDVVAIVLENGVKFITSFLSVVSCCTSAPLNPNYSIGEFEFYYADLKPKAIVTDLDENHPSIIVAKKKKIKVIDLKKNIFINKISTNRKKTKKIASPKLKDIALILHTSGTTSRPKMVALSHQNLLQSCRNISKSLKLKKTDKNIILMPSFHIHGIVASILAPLYVGGQIVALPKFNALSFFKSFDYHKPTWFTAVPTMLQGILDRAKNNIKIINNQRLNFIRSSSASLPASVLERLEKTFKVPVIESYGMTEASHQMTTNLLPPYKRKIGSVGVPIGIKVKVVDNNFIAMKHNNVGEVVIKGKNVFQGYLAKISVNKKAFEKGWFKTGDLGYFDKDNNLFITGRIKEIINRGGEKISPKEVDDVFTSHPKVDKAIAFSVKHEKLGEDLSIAIVLKKNKKSSSSELKEYSRTKLAPFKIPRKIYFLETIPVGPTGKIQRIGLAKKIGIE